MGETKFVPRWLPQRVTIPAGATRPLPASGFANTELWPWRLHWMSVTGVPKLETDEDPRRAYMGGVASRLTWQLGISQKGDINLRTLTTDAMLGTAFRLPQKADSTDVPFRFRFPAEVVLPPDSGLVARVSNTYQVENGVIHSPGILVNGYHGSRGIDREPAQLAAYGPANLGPKSAIPLDAADLFNDGGDDMLLHEMMLTGGCRLLSTYEGQNGDPFGTAAWPFGTAHSWRINPTTGIEWMPDPTPIPAGNIAPWNRPQYDPWNAGPRAYVFPEDTVLDPTQRLSVKVGNVDDVAITLNVALFGLLEVQ